MSSYFKAWNALLTTCPDPDGYTPEPPPVVGRFSSAKPVAQGREQGVLAWDNISLAAWIDLWDVWNTNKDSSGTFVIPPRTSGGSWTSWRSVTAYAEEPQLTYRGRVVQGCTMRLVITA
jgi:hypothetical protein